MSYLEQVVRNAEKFEHHHTSFLAETLKIRMMEENLAAQCCFNISLGELTFDSMEFEGMSFQEELVMTFEEEVFCGIVCN